MQPTTTTYHGKVGFDPLAYELIAIIDEWPPEDMNAADTFLYVGERFEDPNAGWASVPVNAEGEALLEKGQNPFPTKCAHCGKSMSAIRYVAYALHKPTNEVVAFGAICGNELGFANEYQLALHRAEKARLAEKERLERDRKRNEWNAANPEQAAALDAYEADIAAGGAHDEFLDSLAKGRKVYGALTEKQTPWPTKALAKRAEWAARKAEENAKLATAPKLAEGRYEVEGIVLHTKWQESDFAYNDGAFKMLVQLDNGNKVWGTVPRALEGDDAYDLTTLVNCRVVFTAAVERSHDDNHFGYFKRPTKARRIAKEEE